ASLILSTAAASAASASTTQDGNAAAPQTTPVVFRKSRRENFMAPTLRGAGCEHNSFGAFSRHSASQNLSFLDILSGSVSPITSPVDDTTSLEGLFFGGLAQAFAGKALAWLLLFQ